MEIDFIQRFGFGRVPDIRNLLMQDGYSVNGATGSAWNYYQDNSNRLFDPEFVVVGPYKASKTSAYYAGSDGSENVAELIVEACRLADNDVNFTDFADNGVIRDVFVFYAGRGQADSGDTQTIWPPLILQFSLSIQSKLPVASALAMAS